MTLRWGERDWSAWAYAVLVLAAYRAWGLTRGPRPPTCWWPSGGRWPLHSVWRTYWAAWWGHHRFQPVPLERMLTAGERGLRFSLSSRLFGLSWPTQRRTHYSFLPLRASRACAPFGLKKPKFKRGMHLAFPFCFSGRCWLFHVFYTIGADGFAMPFEHDGLDRACHDDVSHGFVCRAVD